MNFEISNDNELTIAKISGRIDATNSDELQNNIVELIASGATKLVIDFSGVNYISSAGLRSILTATKEIMKKSGKLAIFGMQSNIRDVFDMSGFSSIMNITSDLSKAKSSLLS